MHILVIGSEGTIGTQLVKKLKEEPHVSVKRCDKIRMKATDYTMVDITHYETLESVFEPRPDIVFHLAGEVSRETAEHWPNVAVESNVLGTLNVIKFCLKNNSKLIFAGTSEEYGGLYANDTSVTEDMRPRNQQGIYGLTKWLGEELIEYYHRRYGLHAVVVRIFMCYGPGEKPNPYRSAVTRFIEWARHGEPIYVHKGGKRSWCYIDDTIEGLIAASKYDAELFSIFNIGSDELWSMEDVAKKIIEITNSQSKIILEDAPPGITLVKMASFKKAEEVLGWKAQVSFAKGLKKTVEWHIKNVEFQNDINKNS